MKPIDMKAVFFFMVLAWTISSCSSSKMVSNETEWDDTYVRSSRELKVDSSNLREKKTVASSTQNTDSRERLTSFYGPFMPGYAPFSPFGYNPYGYYSDPFGYTYGSPMFYGSYYDPYRYNPWGGPVNRVPGNTFPTPNPRPIRTTQPSNPTVNTRNWNNTSGSRPGSGSRGGWNAGSSYQGNSGFNSGNSFNNNHSNFNSGGSSGFSNPSSGGSVRPSTGGRGGR
jgi:hypothetical protein